MRNFIGAVALAIMISGCGGRAADAPELVECEGTVTVDGNNLPNARVTFYHETKGTAFGMTDSFGKFVIWYNDETRGAFSGPTTVVVKEVSESEMAGDEEDEDDDADYEKREQEKEKSNIVDEWTFKMDVTAESTNLKFELKSEDQR